MTQSAELLLEKSNSALPGFAATTLLPIEKGGSNRRFYRVIASDSRSVILVHDLGEKEENKHYAALAEFLIQRGVPVPRVLAVDHSQGILWLEDLGETDLWASRNQAWEVRRPLYESVLRGIALWHQIPLAEISSLPLQKEFDERLYRWEQEYFVEHCLGGIFGISEEGQHALLKSPSMKCMARHLAEESRQLVHRDFQSQNIMIREGQAYFIDFQGMRPGLAQYDVASLLCDPYVEISPEERTHLLGFYRNELEVTGIVTDDSFERIFWRCAVQRLMQALGAYGFLSIHRGKPAFRGHVAPALKGLREALQQLHPADRLDEVADLLAHLKTPPFTNSFIP